MTPYIRLATEKDIDLLAQLYDHLNDHLEATTNYPGWKKGVYPIRQDAVDGIREGCLFVTIVNHEIAGSMILRHRMEPAYLTATWQMPLSESELLVVYTFVVSPKYLHHGIGRQMLSYASQYASSLHMKAIRLDVYEKNIPAISLYEQCGFHYIATVSLGLEHYGLDWFKLYEKLL